MLQQQAATALLLEHGADINTVADKGLTSLRLAATAGHDDVVQMLLDAGADTGVALTDAVYFRCVHIIKLLLQHKSHPPSVEVVAIGCAVAMHHHQQDQHADDGGIVATLLLHLCLLAQQQLALQPAAAVSALFSDPGMATHDNNRPALALALLRSWGEHTAEVDAAQEKDLAAVKRAAQQAYCQLAAADKAASSTPQPTATPNSSSRCCCRHLTLLPAPQPQLLWNLQ